MVALFLRPDADQSDGGWLNEAASATNLFNSVDEPTTPSDTDYIVSSTTDGDKVRLRLSDPSGGVVAPLIVRYRCKRTGTQAANLIGRLYQGTSPGTLITTFTQLSVPDTFTTYTYTLTSGEFASITDFTDLYVEFELSQQSSLKVDLNFVAGVYYDSGTVADATGVLSCIRASTGYAKDSGGTWISFASNVLRITDLGLLVEDARTNNLLNSDTPATQTTASLGTGSYTLWVEGSGSALASAGSATITGAASATNGSPNTFSVTVAGTVTVTVTGSLNRFQLELGAFASSYIPTTGGTASRAADAVTAIANLNTVLSLTTNSMVFDVKTYRPTSLPGFGDRIIVSAGGNLILGGGTISTDSSFFETVGGAQADFPGLGLFSAGVKIGYAEAPGAASILGAGGTVATSATPAGGFASATLLSNSQPFWGYVRRLTVWNSKLADATLQALTAP